MSSYQCTSDEGDKEEAFRSMLNGVCVGFDDKLLETIKYQCSSHIGKGKLETIKSITDLFAVLEQRDVISQDNVDLLLSCLDSIDRKDLSALVRRYANEWLSSTPEENSKLVQDQETAEKKLAQSTSDNIASPVTVPEGTVQSDTFPFPTEGFQHDNPAALSPFHRELITFVSNQLTFNWQSTARHLGISDNIISAAQYNWPHDLRKQIFETFAEYARYVIISVECFKFLISYRLPAFC